MSESERLIIRAKLWSKVYHRLIKMRNNGNPETYANAAVLRFDKAFPEIHESRIPRT